MTTTEQLLTKVWNVTETADADALAMARVCLLDWLGCAMVGAHERVVECLAADADPVPSGEGFPYIGRKGRAGLRDQVLVNGAASHALDYDDGHGSFMGHPAVTIMAPLLGLCLQRGIGGERLLRGIVGAYEAGSRLGAMISPDHYRRGFHGTATSGAMASAVGAAWMVGSDHATAAMALGLAATRAGGLRASFGTDGKPLHAGWAGYIGLTSLRWAERGMTASPDVVDHPVGLRALTQTFDVTPGLADRPQPWIMATTFKRFAACAGTHPAIRAALSIRDRCPTDRIRHVRIRVAAVCDSMCNIAAPRTGLQLKFSVRGVVAMALLGIDNSAIASYTEDTTGRADFLDLIAKTEVIIDDNRPVGPTDVEIELDDGTVIEAHASGIEVESVADSREAVSAKFLALAGPLVGASGAAALLDEILEGSLTDIAGLFARTVAAAEPVAA